MMKTFVYLTASLLLVAGLANAEPAPPQRPNIIFILADDLGWGDLGVNFQNAKTGKKHSTPELDTMAREGVRMTAHYAPAPICAPSRGSLLLGQHQGHAVIRDYQFDKALPDTLTLGSAMQMAGYRTVLVGKYGLQGTGTDPQSWPAYPTKRGFSEFFGYVRHVDDHMHYPKHNWPQGDSERHTTPKELWHDDKEISAELNGCYTTDLFTAFAKQWIVDHRRDSKGTPFMMMLAYDTPHAALQVASMPYPQGKGLHGGMQWRGKPGEQINTAQGVIDSYIHPDYRKAEWSEVEQRFASSVRRIDEGVGDLLQLLRDLNIDRDTLVVFTSDNGPHHESYIAGQPYTPAAFQSYGPFDGTKADIWEGGIRMPALAWWPSTIPAGRVDDRISQLHDWASTFTELAGFPRPAQFDGIDLMPRLTGRGFPEPSTVYVEFHSPGSTAPYSDFELRKQGIARQHMQAVFLDGYKGVRLDINTQDDDFEIFDLSKDPGERNDLRGSSPLFAKLNQRMKDRVLQLHTADADSPRPYDNLMIPAIPAPSGLKAGLRWKSQERLSPWVAQLTSSPAHSVVEHDQIPRLRPGHLYQAEGYVRVPKEGKLILHVRTQGQVVIKIHDNIVLQRFSRGNDGTLQSDELHLAEGLHPIRIYSKDMRDGDGFELSWTLNGHTTPIPESALVRDR